MTVSEAKALLAKLPKADLGFFPTPLHKLQALSDEFGINLYMKRDDFSGRNLFGGNKIRKLEYLLGDALEKHCDYVFTYGATQSNHAMQTAAAARSLGMTPVLYLVAIVPPDKEDIRSNLLLDQIFGAEIHIIEMKDGESEEDAENRSFEMAKERMKELTALGHRCYDIPMGGANEIGSAAFIGGYAELCEQLEALNLNPDYIFHATGTGGTMAGLAAGNVLLGSRSQIISVNVSNKDESYLIKTADLATKSLRLINSDQSVHYNSDLHMDLNYYAPGYEQPNEAATEAIRHLARTEGILTDPVYTGKALAGLFDYARSGQLTPHSTVIFWHTGGTTALFAESSILGSLNTSLI